MKVKGTLVNLGLMLASTVATALLVEWGLRFGGYESQLSYVHYLGRQQVREALPEVPYLYPSHASFGQVWPGNPRGYFDPETSGITYLLNNYGFRDDDFSLERNDKIRLAFLGDSFCWGNGVRDEDTLASLLEGRLNRIAFPGSGYEVFNFCLSGFGTRHEAALYDHVVRHFRPDILVVWYFLNDVNTPSVRYFNWKKQIGGDWLRRERRKWRLLDLVVAPINRFENHGKLVAATEAAYKKGHPGYASIVRGLGRIRRVNDEDGVRAFLAIFPWLYRLDREGYPFKEAHQTVRALAEQEGFSVLDLLPTYAGIPARDLWVDPVDHHPNERAHELAADAMFEHMRDEIATRTSGSAGNRRQTPPPAIGREGHWWMRFAPSSAKAPEPPSG